VQAAPFWHALQQNCPGIPFLEEVQTHDGFAQREKLPGGGVGCADGGGMLGSVCLLDEHLVP